MAIQRFESSTDPSTQLPQELQDSRTASNFCLVWRHLTGSTKCSIGRFVTEGIAYQRTRRLARSGALDNHAMGYADAVEPLTSFLH